MLAEGIYFRSSISSANGKEKYFRWMREYYTIFICKIISTASQIPSSYSFHFSFCLLACSTVIVVGAPSSLLLDDKAPLLCCHFAGNSANDNSHKERNTAIVVGWFSIFQMDSGGARVRIVGRASQSRSICEYGKRTTALFKSTVLQRRNDIA